MVRKLKANFAIYGGPYQLVSGNGPQSVAAEFQKLTKEWDIKHLVSSPYNSKANGKVEAAVKSAKRMLRNTAKGGDDFHLGHLAERNTPSQGIGSSPVQRLMNRRTRTLLPTTGTLLEPRPLNTNHERERERLKDVLKRQAQYYNANAHNLLELSEGDTVRMKHFVLGRKEWKGVVVERLDERSYEVETADGSSYRRNRAYIKKTNERTPATANGEPPQPEQSMIQTQAANKLPVEVTLAEPLHVSSHLDEPYEAIPCKESGTEGYHALNCARSRQNQIRGSELGQEDW